MVSSKCPLLHKNGVNIVLPSTHRNVSRYGSCALCAVSGVRRSGDVGPDSAKRIPRMRVVPAFISSYIRHARAEFPQNAYSVRMFICYLKVA